MTAEPDIAVQDRIMQVLAHLGVRRAHFAGRGTDDWEGIARSYPDAIASLTLVCPNGGDRTLLETLGARTAVLNGEGPTAEGVERLTAGIVDLMRVDLPGYAVEAWSDVAADRGAEVLATVVRLTTQVEGAADDAAHDGSGEVAEVSYAASGSGPVLVLLPLGLSPSQWEPLIHELSGRFCVVVLGGPHLGFVSILEDRARLPEYAGMVRSLIDEMDLQPGQSLLDIGTGSGALDRWIVGWTGGANHITGADVSPYLIREATAMAESAGVGSAIAFLPGSAEALPHSDGSFDAVLSVTTMEEVDADKMMAEMVRVTKPGGRIGVIVRAVDRPWLINVPLSADLRAKAESPRGQVASRGCADVSLYDRFSNAGLVDLKLHPHLVSSSVTVGPWANNFKTNLSRKLSAEEREEVFSAMAKAIHNGSFFFAQPYHCAVGTKPN